MENENTHPDDLKSLDDFVLKMSRLHTLFTRTMENFKKDERILSDVMANLTCDVEELKQLKVSLITSIKETIKESFILESKVFSHQLSSSFLEGTEKGLQEQTKIYEESLKKNLENVHVQIQQEKRGLKSDLEKCSTEAMEINEKYTEYSDKFRRDIEGIVAAMKQIMTLQKQRLTRKGLVVCLTFCVASVLTGSGLFYFFPQHVHYQDMGTARNLIFGKVAWENLKNLSVKDQAVLLDGMNHYLRSKK